jgi:hypothetical protein
VFGQKYHPQLKCNISDMRECKLIFQRLKLSLNEHLETYVRQHDIVDIEIDEIKFDDNNSDKAYDSENVGEDLDDNAFPELLVNPANFQIGNIYNAGVLDGKSVVSALAMSSAAAKSLTVAATMVAGVSVLPTSGAGGGDRSGGGGNVSGGGSGVGLASGSSRGRVAVTTTAVETAAAGLLSVAIAAVAEARIVNTHPTAPVLNATPTCQLTFDSPPPVVNDITEQATFRARESSIFTVQEAWDHGNIARLFKPPLSSHGEFKFLWPVLTCSECTFVHGAKPIIQIMEKFGRIVVGFLWVLKLADVWHAIS